MIEILKEIKTLSINNEKTLEHIGLKLAEETGECTQAILSYLKANGSAYKNLNSQDIKEECIDVIIVALSLFYKLEGNDEELKNTTCMKLKKWEEKINII